MSKRLFLVSVRLEVPVWAKDAAEAREEAVREALPKEAKELLGSEVGSELLLRVENLPSGYDWKTGIAWGDDDERPLWERIQQTVEAVREEERAKDEALRQTRLVT